MPPEHPGASNGDRDERLLRCSVKSTVSYTIPDQVGRGTQAQGNFSKNGNPNRENMQELNEQQSHMERNQSHVRSGSVGGGDRPERLSARGQRYSVTSRITNAHGDMGTSHYFEQILNKRVGVKDQPMFKSYIAPDVGTGGFGNNLKAFAVPKNVKRTLDDETRLLEEVTEKVNQEKAKMNSGNLFED